ncbi:hypothetical protein Aeqsu_2135 [Aequorivita sublithincola DSM 14238]|uniref:DUF4149 domain-containing protein n=1 Tax=Aequorivita sublithincola (strain DSM 14238 / LMG 21431 / ACAM 643 / 9-3) TaxID=746697 RepID=I3YX79_AEQSU|nr:hypothetical protein Aeqsu_2135 [Aequorivita sublithincola DSM 14238]
MSIEVIRLLLDFGLVVLIWIIQCIVYPSFRYYPTENLIAWHKIYTARFSVIVIPLMLGQIGIVLYQTILTPSVYTVVSLIIIIFVWLVTFLQFVPIHTSIAKGIVTEKLLASLVNKNWIRTVLWTLLFIYSFIYYLLE